MSPTRAIKTTLWQYLMWVGGGGLSLSLIPIKHSQPAQTRKATQKTTLSGGFTPICHFDIDEKLPAICMGVGDTETDFKV